METKCMLISSDDDESSEDESLDSEDEPLMKKTKMELDPEEYTFIVENGGTIKEWEKLKRSRQHQNKKLSSMTLGSWMKKTIVSDGTAEKDWLLEHLEVRTTEWNKFVIKREEAKIDWSSLKLTTPLKDYQVSIVEKIAAKANACQWRGDGCLMMLKQGFGKTLCSLDLICQLLRSKKENAKGILILNLNLDTKYQWGMEIFNHTNIPVSRVFIPKTLRGLKIPNPDQFFIVLGTYSMFSRADQKVFDCLKQYTWDCIVTDEAQYYRDHHSRTFKNLMLFSQSHGHLPFKLSLSGTFIVNSITDLMTQAIWLQREDMCIAHNTKHSFKSTAWWNVLIQRSKYDAERRKIILEEYEEWFKRYVVCLDERSEKTIQESFGFKISRQFITFEMDEPTQQIYDILSKFFQKYANKIQNGKSKNAQWKEFIMVTILFMCICLNHPSCISGSFSREGPKTNDETSSKPKELSSSNQMFLSTLKELGVDIDKVNYKYVSPKMKLIMDTIEKIQKENPGDKIIVFSGFSSFLVLLDYHLKLRKLGNPTLYIGQIKNKTKNLQDFKSGSFDILLAAKKCGSCSLNITEANHVIIAEQGFNVPEQEQCECRSGRIGQKKDVFVYFPICSNSIELWKLYKITGKYEKQMGWTRGNPEDPELKGKTFITDADIREIYNLINGKDYAFKVTQAKSDNGGKQQPPSKIAQKSNSSEIDNLKMELYSEKIFDRYRKLMEVEIRNANQSSQGQVVQEDESDRPPELIEHEVADNAIGEYLETVFGAEFSKQYELANKIKKE